MSENEREARRARLDALRASGVDPFPARVAPRSPIREVRAAHDAKSEEDLLAVAPAFGPTAPSASCSSSRWWWTASLSR